MPDTSKLDRMYMDIALRIAEMSRANRRKVGAVLVKDNNIISFGWNGTPAGFPNECEGEDGKTLPIVIHAEINAYAKLARTSQSSEGATLYTTLSPCFECAKLIIQSKTIRVVFSERWKTEPIDFLINANIIVEEI